MIVGDPAVFAIEAEITRAYQRPSIKASGYFVIYLSGRCYGVRAPEASMLACSLDTLRRRILRRGGHIAPFASEANGGAIAEAVRLALYFEGPDSQLFFGIPKERFTEIVSSSDIVWAPDGDEAFDDGSYVLQFDVDDSVRLIAFRSSSDGSVYDYDSISDVWLSSDLFYGVLNKWQESFEKDWERMPKIATSAEDQ